MIDNVFWILKKYIHNKIYLVQLLLRKIFLLENITEVENLILLKAKSVKAATIATDLIISWLWADTVEADIDLLKCSIVPGFNRDDADNDAVGTNVHAEVYLVDAVFDAGTVAGTGGVDGVSN